MLFTITGKHVDITDTLRQHAEEKAAKLPKFYDSITQVDVIIDGAEGGSFAVEIIARAEHSKVFVGKEIGHDAYTCIDGAVKKIESQLRKKKGMERDDKSLGAEKPGPGIDEVIR